ncbi:MAG: hypothetical protein K2Y21_10165 [Phycisphaerales bacterium]|nr:hypothetical protein [Phycisphaerales bacterium]
MNATTNTPGRRLPRSSRTRPLLALCAGLAMAVSMQGCVVGTLIGGMAESYRKDSTKTVKPETDVLKGKSFAVLVSTDRSIEEMAPGVTAMLIARITDRLADATSDAETTGFVPASMIIQYTYDHPGWRAKTNEDLAKDLGGVQRLIFVELTEFRTKEPGNQYLYDGVCAGTVSVAEADSKLADYYTFEKSILVKFPDETGRRPDELPETAVRTELVRRFVDRATWPFITHEEPYYPKY